MSKKVPVIKWLPEVEEHDYPAAASYLTLLCCNPEEVSIVIQRLREAPTVAFKAKDIFRASELSLLGISNSHVAKDQKKIKRGIALSPLLLVRNSITYKLTVLDGYHRLCAIYSFDEDAVIHCKLI